MFWRSAVILAWVLAAALGAGSVNAQVARATFNPDRDLLSLHYDHAPDKDDGHSAAADRTILESMFGRDWITRHVVAVSGAYGTNADGFNPASGAVMDAAWNECGGWLAAHDEHDAVVAEMTGRWRATLMAGGEVWVKEGGQSDVTADVLRRLHGELPDLVTTRTIHVVQHSDWNQDVTTPADLAYVRAHTDYIRIRDANAYLVRQGGDPAFERAALALPDAGAVWKAAFAYYDPHERIDFSDTGELMRILGLGEMNIDAFRQRFLEKPH